VLLVYAILIANGLHIASMRRDCFGLLLVVGIGTIFFNSRSINIGMTLEVMPIMGIPLLFVSYGESLYDTMRLLQGIIQSIYRFRSKY